MADFITEQLVEKRPSSMDFLKKAALIAITAVIGFFSLMIPFGIIVLIIAIAVDTFLFKRLNVEFEYSYFSGDFTIDKIFSKQSRKRVLSVALKEIDIVAPSDSEELRRFGQLKTLDCSSGEQGRKTYVMVTQYKNDKVKVVIEPKEEIVKNMKTLAPRKVFI